MSERVWIAGSGDVECYRLEGVFASRESALRWLHAERERQIVAKRKQWEWLRAQDADPERQADIKRAYPDNDWDAYFAEKLAKPFPGITEIVDDEFEDGEGGIHGFWRIDEHEVWP